MKWGNLNIYSNILDFFIILAPICLLFHNGIELFLSLIYLIYIPSIIIYIIKKNKKYTLKNT